MEVDMTTVVTAKFGVAYVCYFGDRLWFGLLCISFVSWIETKMIGCVVSSFVVIIKRLCQLQTKKFLFGYKTALQLISNDKEEVRASPNKICKK